MRPAPMLLLLRVVATHPLSPPAWQQQQQLRLVLRTKHQAQGATEPLLRLTARSRERVSVAPPLRRRLRRREREEFEQLLAPFLHSGVATLAAMAWWISSRPPLAAIATRTCASFAAGGEGIGEKRGGGEGREQRSGRGEGCFFFFNSRSVVRGSATRKLIKESQVLGAYAQLCSCARVCRAVRWAQVTHLSPLIKHAC